jgi:hypothetical protein
MRRVPWKAGPAADAGGELLVSLTDFTVARWRDVPGMWLTGLRLRRGWPETEGAVGLWLWAVPRQRRSGSVSVWTSEDALRGFVRRPDHVAIMRRYRDCGVLESTSWQMERAEPGAVWSEALRRLQPRR